MIKVFIDGQEGTTGLQIVERLSNRDDVELLEISEELRKDKTERARLINESDVTFLCLPDDAARESVSLCDNDKTVIIDASTAHRTLDTFAYGFPELSKEHREKIKNSKRIANPGCHATGFEVLVYPLVSSGIVKSDYPFVCQSLTGYSGGGKKMIVDYESEDVSLKCPRPYALGLVHKHLPEMKKVCGLSKAPAFIPVVDEFYAGMTVTVPVFAELMSKKMSREQGFEFFKDYYKNEKFIKVYDKSENGFLTPNALEGKDNLEIYVLGNDEQILLAAVFDNLGKGAGGAAVQNFNIVTGQDEGKSLNI